MVAAVAGGVPVKGAPSCQRCGCLRGSGHLGNRSTMTVYLRRSPLLLYCLRRAEHLRKSSTLVFCLRRRPLSLLLVVHANIPLRLPLRNAIRQSAIYRRSIAASVPLVPAKATEGARGWLLLRKCCTVPRATIGAASLLLLRTLVGTIAVVATAVLRRRPRNIIAGAAAATAV